MEFEVSYSLDNEQQFWDELDDIVSTKCESHERIDDALRSYLSFTSSYKGEYLQTEYDVARCSYKLIDSALFCAHKDYVRRQIIYGLLQEDSPCTLHLLAAFLLFDGRQHEETFETMNEEGAFVRILELIQTVQGEDVALHRMLLELFYEMSRIQRIKIQDLMLIDEDFIIHLLQIVEGLSDDASEPYHYPVIRVLLVLNEQYMVAAHDPSSPERSSAPTNRVIGVLCKHGAMYKTFGENIILLLNRENETSLQLLILKLLYLLFTTPATYEYFYTNDLRVLVDVMIRNLLDLSFSSTALRHTYLRVLYPLLSHTQLRHPDSHYKREEILRLMYAMGSGNTGMLHFGAMDDTTKRLVARCLQVPWLQEVHEQDEQASQNLLGIGMNAEASKSSSSVVEVTAPRAQPGIKTVNREQEIAAASRIYAEAGKIDEAGDDADGPGELKNPFETEVQG